MRVKTPIDIRPGELRCPRCLRRDIVSSLPRGWKDALMQGFGRVPRHCRSCGKRFYARAQEPGGQGPPGEDAAFPRGG